MLSTTLRLRLASLIACFGILLGMASVASAATGWRNNETITQVRANQGSYWIRLSGGACDGQHDLAIASDSVNFEGLGSVAIAAQLSGRTVDVQYDDAGSRCEVLAIEMK